MTVSGQKQSVAQVISHPPAPAGRLDGNGKGPRVQALIIGLKEVERIGRIGQ